MVVHLEPLGVENQLRNTSLATVQNHSLSVPHGILTGQYPWLLDSELYIQFNNRDTPGSPVSKYSSHAFRQDGQSDSFLHQRLPLATLWSHRQWLGG